MKVRKYINRERRKEGLATGDLVCNLSFPENDEQYDLRPLGNPAAAFENVRKFINHHLGERNAQLGGAKFTISAEVRAKSGGLRRKVLAKWKSGESLPEVFTLAKENWNRLCFEEDHTIFETEI